MVNIPLVVQEGPPATQESQVQSLGQEDPLEKEMATHSSILAWKIPWTEEPGGLQSMQLQRIRYALVTDQQQARVKRMGGYLKGQWTVVEILYRQITI